nr:hypothetical protein CFP56_19489 [Quercus suber]
MDTSGNPTFESGASKCAITNVNVGSLLADTDRTASPSKKTISTGGHKRSDSQLTTMTTFTEVSNISVQHPGPPVNSPQTSVAGDFPVIGPMDADTIASRLAGMSSTLTTPPTSQAGDVASPGEHTRVARGQGNSATSGTPQTKQKVEDFPEHSIWASVTEDDVSNALKRLAMLAKDEQKKQPEKTVEDVYTALLTKLIEEGELEFKGLKR